MARCKTTTLKAQENFNHAFTTLCVVCRSCRDCCFCCARIRRRDRDLHAPFYAQAQQSNTAKLKREAQKVVSDIRGDKAKTEAYCQIKSLAKRSRTFSSVSVLTPTPSVPCNPLRDRSRTPQKVTPRWHRGETDRSEKVILRDQALAVGNVEGRTSHARIGDRPMEPADRAAHDCYG